MKPAVVTAASCCQFVLIVEDFLSSGFTKSQSESQKQAEDEFDKGRSSTGTGSSPGSAGVWGRDRCHQHPTLSTTTASAVPHHLPLNLELELCSLL
ncbi:hypothetical protein WN944_009311 [Citrus x changshan-huyou]|uniref:Uncharacterized protein n=1 Tax=Citrus x changshan-huyou TaxID=2935761 RepID=A0AAP0QW39_9ROSI